MRPKNVARIVLLLLAAFLIIAVTLYAALPVIMEKVLLSEVSGFFNGAEVSLRVGSTGANRFDVSGICIGATDNPFITIDAINCDYHFKELLNRKVDNIIIRGLQLKAIITNAGLEIPLLAFTQNAAPSGSVPFSAAVQNLEVLNAAVLLEWDNKMFRIPFSLKASLISPEKKSYRAEVTMLPFHQKITLSAMYDWAAAEGSVSVKVSEFDFGVLAKELAPIIRPTVSGQISFYGAVDVKPSAFQLSALEIGHLELDFGGVELSVKPEETGSASRIVIKQLQQDNFALVIEGLSLKKPFPLRINTDTEAIAIAIKDGKAQLTGAVLLAVDKDVLARDLTGAVRLLRFPEDRFAIEAEFDKDGSWDGRVYWEAAAQHHQLKLDNMNCSFSSQGGYLHANGSTAHTAADLRFEISSASCSSGDFSLSIPSIACSGSLKLNETGDFMIESLTKFSAAALKTGDFYAKQVTAEIPFSLPLANQQKIPMGIIEVKSLGYADYHLGSLSAHIFSRDDGFLLKGHVKPVPHTALDVNGKLSLNLENRLALGADINIGDQQKIIAAKLDHIHRQFAGVSVSGRIGIKTQFHIDQGGFTGRAWGAAKGLDIAAANAGLEISGLELETEIEDLSSFRSKPAQKGVWDSVRLGEIKTGSGEALFQTESVDSFFIEKARLAWADGNIHAHAVRISPVQESMDFILFCDRLKLKNIFNELKIAEAEGDGTLNGRIPVHITKGEISIDNGFLYSAPGQGGRLKIMNTESLDSLDQSLEISIAKDALKDFMYDWAKMTIYTAGDTLFIPVQLYGRPAQALPYTYDKKRGLRRTEDGRLQAKFEGIHFDINFKLPLNRLLRYKQGVDSLMKRD